MNATTLKAPQQKALRKGMGGCFKLFCGLGILVFTAVTSAQTAPSPSDIDSFKGLHLAAQVGNIDQIQRLVTEGAKLEDVDRFERTPLHIAAFASQEKALEALANAGADLNALEYQAYDIVTIAAVANDIEMLELSLALGASAGNITSPYDGTALIAAAHLGHHEVVKTLIKYGAPLDHVNNLGWTALIEAIILGNGGPNHVETVRALVSAGANQNITDREGTSSLEHALVLGYKEIVEILDQS
ncbi:MAG: ankyrin repeat domain-containing protein [Arenicellales bacterium]